MDKTVLIAIISAIICPFIWALVNILDKFVVSNKVKNPLSYGILTGIVNLIIGILLATILDWSSLTAFNQIFYPALAGIIFGSQFFTYLYLLSKEDASHVVGIVYMYPLLVGILSYFFLNEKFSMLTYVGISLVIIGALFLSIRINMMKKRFISWMLVLLIISVALYEFLFKVSTNNLPEWNGIAIAQIFCGITVMLGFFHRNTRKGVLRELKYLKWAIIIESITFFGLITTFFAMGGLPATIVSTVAATQPLAVILLEKLFHNMGIKICKDERLLPKLIPISLIVIGIIILSVF